MMMIVRVQCVNERNLHFNKTGFLLEFITTQFNNPEVPEASYSNTNAIVALEESGAFIEFGLSEIKRIEL